MDKKEIIKKLSKEEKAELLTGRDFWSTAEFEEKGIRSLYLSDGPIGLRKQAAASDHLGLNVSLPATCFPSSSIMACSWDEELGERIGEALGEEAASMNVDVLLGPGLNIKRNPLCGRNFEYYSEDPYLSGKMAASYVRGIQSKGVASCVKHFAANNREYRRMTSDSIMDERTLRELYLRGFEIAVKEGGAKCVMSSYNKVNGIFANENPHLMKDILRGEWGFTGVVVTDWAGSNDRVAGLKCGNELEMPGCKYGIEDVLIALEKGEIEESLLDESIERLLSLSEFTEKKEVKEFDKDAHNELAKEASEKSAVLMENDGILPLKGREKIAVVGDFAFKPRYQGAGSSIVNPIMLTTAIEELKKSEFPAIFYCRGFERYGKKNKKLSKEAERISGQAEVTLFFAGLDEYSEAEGIDRKDMKIPENQIEVFKDLIKAGRKVVLILHCGSSVELDWTEGASAILYMGLSGQAGASACIDLLTGKANPCGKLAETWWRKYEDCPTSDSELFPGGEDEVVYREGLFSGYRAKTKTPPRYEFGYGLSYTKFEYENLRITENEISFDIKNAGSLAGKEIAQLYFGKKESRIKRPKRQLFAFINVYLEKGEKKHVSIAYDRKEFSYYDESENKWEVERGEYIIEVGASSEDIRLSGQFFVEGKELSNDCIKEYFPAVRKTEKRKGMTIGENSTVSDLRYAKGWVGRVFAWGIRSAIKVCNAFGKRSTANTLIMGVMYQPVRGLAKFGGMDRRKMEGLLWMFNGSFFKGFGMFITKGKQKKEIKA